MTKILPYYVIKMIKKIKKMMKRMIYLRLVMIVLTKAMRMREVTWVKRRWCKLRYNPKQMMK
jgi:hypothetical protein